MANNAESRLVDAETREIVVDLPCFKCGYNLRSLALDATCPECASPIQDTIRFGWLQFADPAWLRRIRQGATCTLWLILMIVMNGLPQFYHPCFKSERFLRASDDRFFLVIEARDPKFYQHQTEEFLEALNPISVEALEA